MPTCDHCKQTGESKEWLFSHVMTEGCMRDLGFSSLEEFTEDYKRTENNSRQKAWRDKNKKAVHAKERARKAAEYALDPEKEKTRKRREHDLNQDEKNEKRRERWDENKDGENDKRREEYDPDKEHLRKAKQYTQFSPSLSSSHLSRLFSFFSSWFRSCSRRFLAHSFSGS